MKYLAKEDPQIAKFINEEEKRQEEVLEMIASENYTSKAVMEALGSVLTNKYSEGYPGRRYYQGNEVADKVEQTAIDRAKELFGVPFANVQALSGSVMNVAAYVAVQSLSDHKIKLMGLELASGGHLTHGQPQSMTSRFFDATLYKIKLDGTFDFNAIEKQAMEEKPDVLICGFTAYPRTIDFERFAQIADKVGAYLLADISHIAGLVAGGAHPSPVKFAHIVTTTTHKTLRGPRGALIMVTDKGLAKNADLGKKVDWAIIPGLQGGPHDNQTAGIAVALREAATPEFKKYAAQIVKNSKALAQRLTALGFDLVSGGTDNHLILIDLRNKGVSGAILAPALEVAGIVTNMNGVPGDTMPPMFPSGLRIGTAALTTRGMKEKDMEKVADWMNKVVEEVSQVSLPEEKRKVFIDAFKVEVASNPKLLAIAGEVKTFTKKFPVHS